ncbi:MAG: triose-phosphate isomerase [Desulfovibrio sp.]|jgi:triosephosphate isomerase|nr:triose-phosphate isomerase [Desulfovibrio sp.]
MKLLMAANWKMFKKLDEAARSARDLAALVKNLPPDREVVLFTPFTTLRACFEALSSAGAQSLVQLGGQNCYPAREGAFTGEISPDMLLDCGCAHVLVGHSERRALFAESDDFIGKKCAFALSSGLKVMLCIGETLGERDGAMLRPVLERQLAEGLAGVPDAVPAENLAIAYEPVWAIGTGRVATPPDILGAHALIRSFLKRRFPTQGDELRILYGGSVKPENAPEIISLDNVNGVLVGGASLQADSFSRIVFAGHRS